MNRTELRKKQLYIFSGLCSLFVFFIISRGIGEIGVAYLSVSLLIFLLIYSLLGAGFAKVLEELLEYRREREQYKNMHQMKQSALYLQLGAGILFGLLLFFGARVLATNVFGISSLALLFRVIAVLLPLRLLSALLEGCFLAEDYELQSLVIKIGRLVLTLAFTGLFIGPLGEYGQKASELLNQKNVKALYLVLAVLLALLAAEVPALIAYLIIYYKKIAHKFSNIKNGLRLTDSKPKCIQLLFQKRLPVIAERFLILVPLFLPFVYWNKHTAKVDGLLAYGVFVGQFCLLAGTCVYLFYLGTRGLLGTVREHLEKKESRHARYAFHLGIHNCLANGIYATVFLTVMAKHVASVCSVNDANLLEHMLKTCSVAMILACLIVYFYVFMRENSMQKGSMFALSVGGGLYIAGMIVFIIIPKNFPLVPLVLALICLALSCACMWLLCFRQLRMNLDWMRAFVVPLGAGCVVGLIGMLFAKLFTPHLGIFFTLIMTYIVTLLLYWLILLFLQNFSKKDLLLLPTGKILNIVSRIFHLF